MIRTTLIAALLFLAACAAPYDMPGPDRADMQARIDSFQQAIIRDDVKTVIGVVPPKVINLISTRSGIPVASLRKQLIEQARKSAKAIKIDTFGMATDAATFGQTKTGRGYALIPTQTTFTGPSGIKRQAMTQTLAFKDDGIWYLVRVADAGQTDLLKEAYPEFAPVRFPKSSVQVVQ